MKEYAALACENMVKSQLMPNRVVDERLLSAIASVPREIFVSPQYAGVAYLDEDVEIGNGRYLAEPVAFARLLQHADIRSDESVLDVGGATGYSSAVISYLAKSVVLTEENYELLELAAKNLSSLNIDNVKLMHADLKKGCVEFAPFDVIFMCGFVDEAPDSLLAQLAAGGRLVTVGKFDGVKRACVYSRSAKGVSVREGYEAQIRPLPGFDKIKEFEF